MKHQIDVNLADEQIRWFHENGFLSIGRITTDKEIEWLRSVSDEVVRQRTGYDLQDTSRSGGHPASSLMTLVSPEEIVPRLNNTLFAQNARKVVARLFDIKESNFVVGWRLFLKPECSGETPWHQDAAYRPPPHLGATIWMPLVHVATEESCLRYLRGSHLNGLRPHHFHHNHLTAEHVDATQAVMCPLMAGEACVHHCSTLHYAGPNPTDRPRSAFAMVFQVIPNIEAT